MPKLLENLKFEYAAGFMMGGVSEEEVYCFGNDDLQLLIYPYTPRIDVEIVGLGIFIVDENSAVQFLRDLIKVKKEETLLKDILSTWMKKHPSLLLTE